MCLKKTVVSQSPKGKKGSLLRTKGKKCDSKGKVKIITVIPNEGCMYCRFYVRHFTIK